MEKNPNLKLALFIDAATSKEYPVGTVIQITLDTVMGSKTELTTTTHGIRITEFLKMLKDLRPEIMPKRLKILAIIVSDIGYGESLSEQAINAIPKAINEIKVIIHNQKD